MGNDKEQTAAEPLNGNEERMWQFGGDENTLWLVTNPAPDSVPRDDVEFLINTRTRLGLPVAWETTRDGTPGTRCFAQVDEHGKHCHCLVGRAKLHDVF